MKLPGPTTHSLIWNISVTRHHAHAETENVVVGGLNRWPYETFINWEMWFPAFPVLFYFKVRALLICWRSLC